MKPDLRENSTFLRYYEILQANPTSVVFAPLAELLVFHGCYEEAVTVCKKGLEKNPGLVSGRIAMAKAYVGVSNFKRAAEEAAIVLKVCPDHPLAKEIAGKVAESPVSKATHTETAVDEYSSLNPAEDVRWNTVTMADIFASQGNIAVAKKIYGRVIEREPGNSLARQGLAKLAEKTVGSFK